MGERAVVTGFFARQTTPSTARRRGCESTNEIMGEWISNRTPTRYSVSPRFGIPRFPTKNFKHAALRIAVSTPGIDWIAEPHEIEPNAGDLTDDQSRAFGVDRAALRRLFGRRFVDGKMCRVRRITRPARKRTQAPATCRRSCSGFNSARRGEATGSGV